MTAMYGNLLIDNQLNLPPYAGARIRPEHFAATGKRYAAQSLGGSALTSSVLDAELQITGSSDPSVTDVTPPSGHLHLRPGIHFRDMGHRLAKRLPLTFGSTTSTSSMSLGHGWVADVGYVGSHGIHLYNWSRRT